MNPHERHDATALYGTALHRRSDFFPVYASKKPVPDQCIDFWAPPLCPEVVYIGPITQKWRYFTSNHESKWK